MSTVVVSPTLPPCPTTGRPAIRRVQGFSTQLLIALWRAAGAGDVSSLFAGIGEIVLYESDTGLYFFDPMIAGDNNFYQSFYGKHRIRNLETSRSVSRVEFKHAATYVPSGASVLDVGCGAGLFAQHVSHAHFHGLDPYAPKHADRSIMRTTLEEHSERFSETYDVVTAFQVIEHTADPRRFTQRLLKLLKPGGLLMLGAPLHPSTLTEIPNLMLNAPPHHLTWWCPSAFQALATAFDLKNVQISTLPASPHEGLIFWMRFFSVARPDAAPNERYLAHRWMWHLNLAWCYGLGRLADRLLPLPKLARPIDVFMVARKSSAHHL